MNIYRAKGIFKKEILTGQLVIKDTTYWLVVEEYDDEEDEFCFINREIDPSTLEVVSLDLNDIQKKRFIKESLHLLHKINRHMKWIIGTCQDIQDSSEINKRAKFFIEQITLEKNFDSNIESDLRDLKEASELLKGVI